MKKFATWNIFGAFVALMMFAANIQARELPDFTELVADNSDAVVNISTISKGDDNQTSMLPPSMDMPEGTPFDDLFKHFFNQPGSPSPHKTKSMGSGFVLSSDGYIVTNHHVVKDADKIIVRFSDRTELEAKLLGSDERSDVALLKVDAKGLKTLKLGDSDKLKVGEWVLAIGSPFGFDYSATAGIISALGRSLPSDSYVPFIQTDVAINPGNSGGPLFNLKGEVIGVNSQIYSRTGGFMGVSFAIPIDTVMDVVAQIKAQGHVTRGWLGVVIQDVNRELAESFGLEKPSGALVSRVISDSPAAKAGFEAGDVILNFNGKAVETSSHLPPIVGTTPVGTEAKVEIMRKKAPVTLTVKIEALPDNAKNDNGSAPAHTGRLSIESLGIQVKNLTDAQRQKAGIKSGGVEVMRVESGPAAFAGIRPGDMILSLDNQDIENAKQLADISKDLPVNKAIPVLVQRNGGAQFLAIKIEKGGEDD